MAKPFVVILAGLFMLIVSINHAIDHRAFNSRGKEAVLEPIEKYSVVTRKRGTLPVDSHLEADVKFLTESGELVFVHKKLTQEMLEDLAAKRPVAIRYLPDDPKNARLSNENPGDGKGGIGFAVVTLLVGIVWFRKASANPA
jgi:hypothetical protein